MANTLKATPGSVGVWSQIMSLDSSDSKVLLCKCDHRGRWPMASQNPRNWPFIFQLTIWYVKGFSDHSNMDYLNEQPYRGHLFLHIICHVFSQVTTRHWRTNTGKISTVLLYLTKFTLISSNNETYKHHYLNLIISIQQ